MLAGFPACQAIRANAAFPAGCLARRLPSLENLSKASLCTTPAVLCVSKCCWCTFTPPKLTRAEPTMNKQESKVLTDVVNLAGGMADDGEVWHFVQA